MKKIFVLALFLALTTSCSDIKTAKINDISIPVELAVTGEQQKIGLMNRTSLEGGMLFIYDNEAQRYFWMKNTLIPLDIIYINEKNMITGIHHAIPCEKDPCPEFPGFGKYVLEVNGNFTNENNIKEGDFVSLVK
ncbi:DUF192 domain-containing protein [Candidatus Woesearchaeota archaeon]|nr:DUF192 domain-containing protein [Candidatus Woesearchaeota archaeon]